LLVLQPLPTLRKRSEQRLRLFDFHEFRRRRKTFERWRQRGVGIGCTVSGSIKFRQRESCAQLEASRFLLLGDSDGLGKL
jgi:hypothetical protein